MDRMRRAARAMRQASSYRPADVVRDERPVIDDPPLIWVALDLAENVLRQQLFQIDGRLHLGDLAVRLNDLLRSAGAELDELLADEALGLDRRDGVFRELHAVIDGHDYARLIVVQPDRGDPAHLHS